MGLLDKLKLSRLREGLSKTRESLFGRVERMLTARSRIDDTVLEELEEILLRCDVGVSTTETVIANIRDRVKKDRYENPAELNVLLRDEIAKLTLPADEGSADPFTGPLAGAPHVIMVVGVNGAGKTTTIGKLASQYKQSGRAVVIAAADTFRAAANEQIEIWAQRAGVPLVRQQHGSDPASVAFDALQSSKAQGADVLIIDTAGRLHTKVNLMEELRKIERVLRKIDPSAPHEVLLVLDASTGQNGLAQARVFASAVAVSGIVLTKLDGTAKGGIVLAIRNELGIPVRFIGVGERIDDLQPFDGMMFVEALFQK
ncbi:MAG TPA: signal recognition particle-docking protein FtsY [Bacteroidota bacterium]|nr:signal recognition particle-docking protein FtsY [Bacteroidota bacterium]